MGYSQSVTNRQKLKTGMIPKSCMFIGEYKGRFLFKDGALSLTALFQGVYRVPPLQLRTAHRQPNLPAPVQG